MNTRTLTPDELFAFVSEQVPTFKEPIALSTRLAEDLGLLGDDAIEFLEEFARVYEVDFSGFIFSEYFPGEGSADMHIYISNRGVVGKNFLRELIRLDSAIWSLFTRQKKFKQITVANIYACAQSGKWLGV